MSTAARTRQPVTQLLPIDENTVQDNSLPGYPFNVWNGAGDWMELRLQTDDPSKLVSASTRPEVRVVGFNESDIATSVVIDGVEYPLTSVD